MTAPFAHLNLLTNPAWAAAAHRNLAYVDRAAKPKGVSALMKCSPCLDSREFRAVEIPDAHEPWAAAVAVATVSVTPVVPSEEPIRLPTVACDLQLPEHAPMVALPATVVVVATAHSARAEAG